MRAERASLPLWFCRVWNSLFVWTVPAKKKFRISFATRPLAKAQRKSCFALRNIRTAVEEKAQWQSRGLGDANARRLSDRAVIPAKTLCLWILRNEQRRSRITQIDSVQAAIDLHRLA